MQIHQIAPSLLALARQMQEESQPRFAKRESVLAPALVILAEFRYLGYSSKFMHEFAERAGLGIGYSSFCAWLNRHVGQASGPGSKAAGIVQEAVNLDRFTSPHFEKQAPGSAAQKETAQASSQAGGEKMSQNPEAAPGAQSAAEKVSILKAAMAEMNKENPFSRIASKTSAKNAQPE